MRALILRPAALGALTVFSFTGFTMFGEAHAMTVANAPIVNTACASLPKNAVLTASRPRDTSNAAAATSATRSTKARQQQVRASQRHLRRFGIRQRIRLRCLGVPE